jgi:phosphoglycolate phosphatase
MRYRVAIFDFDGTLADSISWFRGQLEPVTKKFGLVQLSAEEVDQLAGMSTGQIMKTLGVPKWKLPLIARHVRGLSARSDADIPLFPGVEELLTRLHEGGVHLAVASSNAEVTIRRVLGPQITSHFEQFECGVSMFGKASRIKRILKRAGATKADAILIGDETRDVEAAHKAGIASAAVHWGYAAPNALHDLSPTASFNSIEELGDFLLSGK